MRLQRTLNPKAGETHNDRKGWQTQRKNQGHSSHDTRKVRDIRNICSRSILQKTPCLVHLKLKEAEIWTRLWEEGGGQGTGWERSKTAAGSSWSQAFFPLSRKIPLLPCLPQIGTSYILSWFPRARPPCQFQRPFLLMSKPRPDIIKCTPCQDKQAPVQSLSWLTLSVK